MCVCAANSGQHTEVNYALIVTIIVFFLKLQQRLVKKVMGGGRTARGKDEHQSKSESMQAIKTEWASCGCTGFLIKSST